MFGLSVAGAPWTVLVMRRSTGRTSTVTDELSLPGVGSGSVPDTVAVLRSAEPAVPAAGRATTVNSADAPEARAPRVQVTVLDVAAPTQPPDEET
ncbi:unannotated protein [freshwater metagenome]|uniref:Unannotated protein n=1 Tax=freshwater metagenome TaxID=449393 RepID=A0A6J7J4X4_9ZZZZ